MPPEQLPWDRRDFRKHERSASDPRFGGGGFGGGGQNRWREQHHHPHAPPPHAPPYHHHHNNHQQQQRWYSDFRSSRPIHPGHGKQGGWHMYPDEAGHGFLPFGSRYGERNLEDDNFRPFGSRADGRYLRNSRENRGSLSHKDWRSPSWEPSASSSGPGRPTTEVTNQKSSLENTQTCDNNNTKTDDSSHPLLDIVSDQSHSQSIANMKHEKNGGTADGPASPCQKSEKENGLGSIDWKPLKWTRSGSLTSRGSGFSHSSSSKSMGVDSTEVVAEVQHKKVAPLQSPAAASVLSTAPAPPDDTSSRKKPRLGWGEGLAKYEKKKVEGPEDGMPKYGLVVNVTSTENMQSPSVNLLDKSPRIGSFSDCASPATPSSVACSSSPGVEEKESIKAVRVDHDVTNLSCSPSIMSQTQYDGPTFSLENLELTSIANLSSLIDELLQSDDQSSSETGYVRNTSMKKLLVWKVDILKALEVTESEIDSLETELKTLTAEPRSCYPRPAASSLLPGECHVKPCEEQVTASSFTVGPTPLKVVSSQDMIGNTSAAPEDEHVMLKDREIDSPGSATSKLVEVLPSGVDAFPSETAGCMEGFVTLDSNNASTSDQTCLENGVGSDENTCHVDAHKPVVVNCQNLASDGNAHSDGDYIYHYIVASNKDSAERALEELNKSLPTQQCLFDISTASSVTYFLTDPSVIKEKFLMRKRFLRFKEKILTLKFKVFQHFWKEGRIVSVRSLRGKSHKKLDPSRTGYKRNRSSSRSRISFSAGAPRTVPVEEVIEFVNELLSESAFKPCRNSLKMPALILEKEIRKSRFISNNGLVEDPCAAERDRSLINPWTAEEREIFIDKLAIFGKNFRKIASFLQHKTVADCVEFYYKNHKSECFERARNKTDFAKQRKSQSTAYLVAAGKRWNREANAASLDILGEASIIAADVNDGIETQRKCASRISFASSSHKAPRIDDGQLQRSNSLDMYSNETVAADVLAGICGSLSSEAMSSCITSSVDPADGYQDWKCQRVTSCIKRPLTPDVTQNIDDECSDESCGEMDPTDWTDEEKAVFIQAVSSYGKDFLMISQCVRTRSREQCKIFFSKARKCLGLDQIQPEAGNAVSDDVNGGGSDIEDACVLRTSSVICNDGLGCKMEEDLPPPDMKFSCGSDIAGKHNLKPDFKICRDTSIMCPLDPKAAEPVVKISSMVDTPVDDRPVMDVNAESKEKNGACGPELEIRTSVVSSNIVSKRVDEGEDHGLSNGLNEPDNKALDEVSDGHCWEENEGQGLILPEDNLDNKKVEDRDANSSEVTVISCAASEIKSELQLAGNVTHPSFAAHSSVQVESGCQKEADLETLSAEKSRGISMPQNGHLASVESSMLFSVPIKYQRHSGSNALSNVDANRINKKPSQKIVRIGDSQQPTSGCSPLDPESSQILKGYPVSVHTVKEINGDVNSKKHVLLRNIPKRDAKLLSDRHTEFTLHKCTSSRHQSEVVQALFPSQEQGRVHPLSGCSPDVDKPSRNGDVKLFGTILISSQQKPNSCVQEPTDDNGQHNKAGCQSLNLKFSADQKGISDASQSKFVCNDLGSENIPARSFSFWDGNRTQTGFPPLPDSALLLTKYPAAFSSHSTSAGELEQPPFHGVVRSNDCPRNDVSIFPSGDLSSSNGVADYHVLRQELQSFTIDMKQSQDVVFSEMQRRNGFDAVSGAMQQQARGMVGVNVVGRGGVLVGGQCPGVSDPVTAIKMHYANAQNYNGQAGNVIREDDKWRSNGDAGR
ncbi:Nuclear receptor corepressor 1 [Sesamum alatum]|uniref:Nuclear receptor corepressor 1 n=1 Tax=Sesamum alatum TaxID=300844 RepID=A0AAE1YTL0_9LAMI|nr:Nuclear receptor corepressor 1 [Sesamum alatum]